MKKLVLLFAFGLMFLAFPFSVSAQAGPSCDLNVGPELPDPNAGQNVVCAKNFSGVASVINLIEFPPVNTISCRAANKEKTILRLEVNSGTTTDVAARYANWLNTMGESQFPGGVKAVVLGVEVSNLSWWGNTGISLEQAGRDYAKIFNAFTGAISDHSKWPVAPAPPDLYNADYDPSPWLDGFLNAVNCGGIDTLTADVFDVPPAASVGGAPLETYKYLESRVSAQCGARTVSHFEGWGAWPGSSVRQQVDWYATHPPPTTATTLIAPNCGSKKADGAEWWYYACGKVYKADGSEVDPDNCDVTRDICVYDDPTRKINFIDQSKEFHSLRPYPACPYEPFISDVSYYMCANDLIANEKFTIQYNGGAGAKSCKEVSPGVVQCDYEFENRSIPVNVDLSQTKFPIMGLTEGPYVNNSKDRAFGTFTDAQKVNEYVSWYLNGTTGRAEGNYLTSYDEYPVKTDHERGYEDTRALIDYSGPLKKLLPLNIQNTARELQIAKAVASQQDVLLGDKARHDQTVACTYNLEGRGFLGPVTETVVKVIGFLADIIFPDSIYDTKNSGAVVQNIPGPCYPEKDSDGNAVVKVDVPNAPDLNIRIKELRLTDWLNHFPPDKNSEEFRDKPFSDYWKAYQEWRGKFCTPTIIGFYLCFDDAELSRPNYWSNLFDYIPFSSTEDRIGYAEGDLNATAQPGGDVSISQIAFEPTNGADGKVKYLYFPHMQETSELGDLLQSTYVPQGEDKTSGIESRQIYDTSRCEPVKSESNPGDKLHGEITAPGDEEMINGDIKYSGGYTCRFERTIETDPVTGKQVEKWSECSITASTALSVYSAVPLVEDVYSRYVNGDMSAFKRFYPKIGVDTPVDKIEDIPAEGQLSYSSGGENPETYAGDPSAKRPGTNAKIYFPHIGSIYDYFLKGIQKALRPLGIGSPSTTIGLSPPGYNSDTVYESVACPTSKAGIRPYQNGQLCQIPASSCTAGANDVPEKYRGAFMENARDLAARWVGESVDHTTNHFDQCYWEVVKRSLDAGVNPVYTLAIWIQESGASNYDHFTCDPNDGDQTNDLQDFGFNRPSIAGNFDAQLNNLLALPSSYPNDYKECFADGCNWGNYSLVYQQGANGACEVNSDAVAYAQKTLRTIALLAPYCQPKYPTDISCP